jgi:hypothetical protein
MSNKSGTRKTSVGKSYKHYVNLPAPSSTRTIKKVREERIHLDRAASPLEKLSERLNKCVGHLANSGADCPKVVLNSLPFLLQLSLKALGYIDDVRTDQAREWASYLNSLFFDLKNLRRSSRTGEFIGRSPDLIYVKTLFEDANESVSKMIAWLSTQRVELRQEEEKLRQKKRKKTAPSVFSKSNGTTSSTLPASKTIKEFFDGARDKGWKVDDGIEIVETPDELAFDEGFDTSCTTITSLKKSRDSLLDRALPVGMVRFPILVVRGSHSLNEGIIDRLVKSKLKYAVHQVFTGYLVLENVLLVGVRKDLVLAYSTQLNPATGEIEGYIRSSDTRPVSKTKVRIDHKKYKAFAPYLSREYYEFRKYLKAVGPVNPSLLYGNHYYTPLFPKSVASSERFQLGHWSLLTDHQKS